MGKKPYVLTRIEVAGILSTVALNVAGGSSNTHPVDIACSMACAVEHAAETLVALRDLGLIEWRA